MLLCVFSLLQADVFLLVNRLARTMLMKNTHTHTHKPNPWMTHTVFKLKLNCCCLRTSTTVSGVARSFGGGYERYVIEQQQLSAPTFCSEGEGLVSATQFRAKAARSNSIHLFHLLGSLLQDVVPGLLTLLHELPHQVLQVRVDRRHAHHARLLRELQLYTRRASVRGWRGEKTNGGSGVRWKVA